MKVGLVDDSAFMRMVLRQILSAADDIDVAWEAADGDAAITCNAETAVDLIITDMEMPRCDGLQLLTRLKSGNVETIIHLVDRLRCHMADASQPVGTDQKDPGRALLLVLFVLKLDKNKADRRIASQIGTYQIIKNYRSRAVPLFGPDEIMVPQKRYPQHLVNIDRKRAAIHQKSQHGQHGCSFLLHLHAADTAHTFVNRVLTICSREHAVQKRRYIDDVTGFLVG